MNNIDIENAKRAPISTISQDHQPPQFNSLPAHILPRIKAVNKSFNNNKDDNFNQSDL